MTSEYSYSCSMLEPFMDAFFPCATAFQPNHDLQDDDEGTSGCTPKHSNCSPKESMIHTVPSTDTDTTATMSESSSSKNSRIRTSRESWGEYPYHPDSRYYGQVYNDYGASPSSWHPSIPSMGSWREEGNFTHSYWQQPEYRQSPPPPPPHHAQHSSEPAPYFYAATQEPEEQTAIQAVHQKSSGASRKSIESKRDLRDLDIVCGRGAPSNYHYGNSVFRKLIEQHQTSYLCAKRSDKPHIAMNLLDQVKASGGRFVRRQKTAQGLVWCEINDKGAYEKVCQGLRDGSPDLRQKVLSRCKKEDAGKENNRKA